MKVKIFHETDPYYGKIYFIENQMIQLGIAMEFGIRITHFSLIGKPNILAYNVAGEKHVLGEIWKLRGGHRLWYTEEAFPKSYLPDNNPISIEHREGEWLVTQPTEPITHLKKSIIITLEGNRVYLKHVLKNEGLLDTKLAPWSITALARGGHALFPLSKTTTEYTPSRSLAIWPYTDLTSPALEWHKNELLVHQAKIDKSPLKIGTNNTDGYLQYTVANQIFTKHLPNYDPSQSYPDMGCNAELYCDENLLELELLGPIALLKPQESLTLEEVWELTSTP